MSRWWTRGLIVLVGSALVAGAAGVAVGGLLVLSDRFAPRLRRALPVVLLGLMVVVVMVEGAFEHRLSFVTDRPIAHLLGLATALAVVLAALAEPTPPDQFASDRRSVP